MKLEEKHIEVIKNFRVECDNCSMFYDDSAEIFNDDIHGFIDELTNDGWTYDEGMSGILCPGCSAMVLDE